MVMGVSGISDKVYTKLDSKTHKRLMKGEVLPNLLTKDQKTTLINEDFIYCDKSKLVHLNVNDNCKRTKNIEDTKFKELDTWLELKDLYRISKFL